MATAIKWHSVDAMTFHNFMSDWEGRVRDSYTADDEVGKALVVRWESVTNGNELCGRQFYRPNGYVENYICM